MVFKSAFLVAILNIYIPQNLGTLVNSVIKMLKDNTNEYFNSIYEPSIKLIKLYTAQSFFTFSYIYLLGIIGENMAFNLKKQLFSNLIKQDISFYDNSRSGELMNRFFYFN